MNYYMGCKLIKATPAIQTKTGNVYGKTDDMRVIKMFEGENVGHIDGYKIVYEDGYESFSPKEAFEKSYMKVEKNPKLASNVSIGPEMVKNFLKKYEVIERDDKTTIVHATLVNGFTIVESSSCVDPTNYSVDIGTQICLNRIENKIWELLGFMLQSAYQGVK